MLVEDHCHVCHMLEATPAENIVHSDNDWTISTFQDVPGLLMMFSNSHDEGFASLPDTAAASFGVIVRSLSAQIATHGDFDRVALMHLGDRSQHTHLLLVGRPSGDAAIADTSALQLRIPAMKDPAQCTALAARMRSALSDL